MVGPNHNRAFYWPKVKVGKRPCLICLVSWYPSGGAKHQNVCLIDVHMIAKYNKKNKITAPKFLKEYKTQYFSTKK